MATIDTAVNAIHLLFAGLWAGSVLFVARGLVPEARDGNLDATPLRSLVGRFRTWSRVSSLALFLTGGHLAGTRYTAETLLGSTRGYLVVAMVVLWVVLTGLVEVGSGRLIDGLDERKVRDPARRAAPFLTAAAVAAVGLLVLGGVLL
ncbi:CopD family protein [Haloplanus halophilus]|uniref:CopD family protein n=1 Tax=Haloplanus halophilus TaxID=2949993 RepID=UPI0020418479|nr:CopD family protein [Haloplanus sp. GDY1]